MALTQPAACSKALYASLTGFSPIFEAHAPETGRPIEAFSAIQRRAAIHRTLQSSFVMGTVMVVCHKFFALAGIFPHVGRRQ